MATTWFQAACAAARHLRTAATCALMGAATAAAAADAAPLAAEQVGPGLYRLGEAGSAALLRVGTRGLLVVDAGRTGGQALTPAEIQRVAGRPGLPITALVLTAATPGQAGGAAAFVNAGVPLVAQKLSLPRLPADVQASLAAAGAGNDRARPPLASYDTDYVVQLGGDAEVLVEHVGRGRTGADSVVWFNDLRTVAVGELYTAGTPQPDCASGGSLAGWAAAIEHLLFFNFDVAIPSRGAPVGKSEFRALRAKLLALQAAPAASNAGGCRR